MVVLYTTKNGRGVFRGPPYTKSEEQEFYGRQTPKVMHHLGKDETPSPQEKQTPESEQPPQEE